MASCRSRKGTFYQPKSEKFNLKKENFNCDKLIDTKSVYLNSRDSGNDGVIVHRMMRFSNDGGF
jgi:hypothetical protein